MGGVGVASTLTSTSFPWIESISGCAIQHVGPGVDDRLMIDELDCGHDAILEFLLGCDADVAQHRSLARDTRASRRRTGSTPMPSLKR